jgi:hypothetical protein
MDKWNEYYRAETRRRQDEIKFAEAYRKAKHDPDEPPGPSLRQRFFKSLGSWLVREGKRLQEQQPVPRRDYAHE